MPSLSNKSTKTIQPEVLRYILSDDSGSNADIGVISVVDSVTSTDVTESVPDVTPIK